MGKKEITKNKIIETAWELFHQKGYENTTVDEIIKVSQTAKSSFYYYFSGKDALLETLSILFDEKYKILVGNLKNRMTSFDKLVYLNRSMHEYIEKNIDREILASLYSSQLITKGERHLLDQNRIYYKTLYSIVSEGQKKGELVSDIPASEIVHMYAFCERAFIYDWCIYQGNYSLSEYSAKYMPQLLSQFVDCNCIA